MTFAINRNRHPVHLPARLEQDSKIDVQRQAWTTLSRFTNAYEDKLIQTDKEAYYMC